MRYVPKTTPYPHQEEAFNRHKDDQYFALLADMGVGKTKITIDIAGHKYINGKCNRMLIIAPNRVHTQWVSEQFAAHFPYEYNALAYTPSKTKKYLRALDSFMMDDTNMFKVFAINIEAFQRPAGLELARRFFANGHGEPFIVVDEASRIKNPSAKSVRNVMTLVRQFPGSYRTAITGTPAAKSPVDMWSIFEFLCPGYMGCSHTAFTHEHQVMMKRKIEMRGKGKLVTVDTSIDEKSWNNIRKFAFNNRDINGNVPHHIMNRIADRFGMKDSDVMYVLNSKEFTRHKNLNRLQRKIAPASFSVSKEECLDLPPKQMHEVRFDLTAEQKKMINELKKYAVTAYGEDTLTIETSATLGLRVLQICGGHFPHHAEVDGEYAVEVIKGPNRKLNFILDDIQEIGQQAFIVWAVFVPELRMLKEHLSKYVPTALIGAGEKGREEAVDGFKRGDIQCLVCHPQAAGYGLNLQRAGVQYWYSRDYRTEARLQSEDRSHRIGITKSPIYKDLVYNCVFEDKVLQSNKEGKDLNTQFMHINEIFGA